MRKFVVVLLVVTILSMALAATASAAGGSPPPALSSGFMLQNRSTTNAASVVIDYYDTAGSVVKSVPDTIAANGAKGYFVPNVTGLPDGRYSVVVSSSESLFSIVNESTAAGATPPVQGSHSGFSDTDTGSPLFMPWVTVGYYQYNSMIAIQNAGTAPTNITVDFTQSGSSSVTKSYPFNNVAAGASIYLDMTADPYKTDLQNTTANGFSGGVKASSTGNATPLAAIVNDTNPAGSMVRSYNAVKSSATTLIAPQVDANYYNYSSGLVLQNPGGTAASVTMKFYKAGVAAPTMTYNFSLPGNAVQGLFVPNITGDTGKLPTQWVGSCVVTSNQPILGIAQVTSTDGPASTYNMVADTEAATTVYMPQVNHHYYGYNTGYAFYNVGTQQVTVQVVFTKDTGGTSTITQNVGAGQPFTIYLGGPNGDFLGEQWNGGAVATVTAGTGKLIGVVNFRAPGTGDNERTYNMFHN